MLPKRSLFTIIILFILSCQQDKNEYYQPILKNEKGDFRGIDIGNTLEQIKAIENDSFLVDKMDDYLYYDYEISMGNSYTISYDFSPQNKLYEIEITTYLEEVKDAQLLFIDFTRYFNKKYDKKSIAKDGFTTWKTLNKKSDKSIEFAMINKSESYGIILIKIRDLDN
jgi:hypothetical protein